MLFASKVFSSGEPRKHKKTIYTLGTHDAFTPILNPNVSHQSPVRLDGRTVKHCSINPTAAAHDLSRNAARKADCPAGQVSRRCFYHPGDFISNQAPLRTVVVHSRQRIIYQASQHSERKEYQ